MAKYKAYPEYKDSGVEWLGKIPDNWYITKLKFVANLLTSKSSNEDELFVGLENISSGDGKYLAKDSTLAEGISISFKNNDVLFGKLRPYLAKSWLATFSGVCSSEFLVLRTERLHPRFLNYYLLTKEFIDQVDSSTYGSKMPRASWEFISLLPVPTCSYFLSDKIASFLDHETAKIDNLIEKQQQLIELLKEKRQAVISHAVTKGLNPDVPMKDSGVEWLGEVPEHWGITKLKWVGRTTSGGTPTTSKFEIYYEDGHIPWIRTTDLSNGELFDTPIRITSKAVNDTACSILPVGSVLLGMYGGAGSIGKHAILRFESTINQAVCGVLPCARILPDYLHKYYEFYRPFWMVDAAGTRKDPNIGQDNIKEGIILIPPFEEQIEINNHIDIMRNIYECIIENALEGVGLLQERRTALISAAVTGKIDVRDWVAPNACEAEVSQEATA